MEILIQKLIAAIGALSLLLTQVSATIPRHGFVLGEGESDSLILGAATGSGSFPTSSLNNFQDGDIINAGDWNALERKIGIDSSTDRASLDWMARNMTFSRDGALAFNYLTTSTDRVGIGTDRPSSTLHVVGGTITATGGINATSSIVLGGNTNVSGTFIVGATSTMRAIAATNVSSSGNVTVSGALTDAQGNKYSTSTSGGGSSNASSSLFSYVLSADNAILPDSLFANPGRATTTNLTYNFLSFQGGTTSSAVWNIPIPSGIVSATTTLDLMWSTTSTAAISSTINISWRYHGNSSTIDQALGSNNATSSIFLQSTSSNIVYINSINLPSSTSPTSSVYGVFNIQRQNAGATSSAWQLLRAVLRYY